MAGKRIGLQELLSLFSVVYPSLVGSPLCCAAGEVCPASWRPGGKSMTADPKKSKEYFAAANPVTQ